MNNFSLKLLVTFTQIVQDKITNAIFNPIKNFVETILGDTTLLIKFYLLNCY